MTRAADAAVRVRRPVDADHRVLVGLVDGWFGRRVQAELPRFWFRAFTTTSAVAEDDGGRPVGFAVGFVSGDDSDIGWLHLVGVHPARRRHGIGRVLVTTVAEALDDRGATRVMTAAPADEPIALAFLRAVGFRVEEGPDTRPLYGTPAHADWNRQGDDRVVLSRPL